MREIKGVIHVHSTYSDGEMTLAALSGVFRENGYHFVCLTEHAEDLDPDRMAALVDQCRDLSDESFCLIPGLEVDSTEGLHLLGVGLSQYVGEGSAGEIIAAIHGQGGLAILAHPKRGAEWFLARDQELPDGLELWNTKHDSRYAPRLHRFSTHRRLRAIKPDLCGYCSVDFHWAGQYRDASLVIRTDRVTQDVILGVLRSGQFLCKVGHTPLEPQGEPLGAQLLWFGLRECYARLLLLLIRGMKRAARALSLPLPKRYLRVILLRFL